MKLGLDVFLEKDYKEVIGQRIGLVTNMTGVNQNLIPTIDLFSKHPDIQLVALFGPEHGIRGDAKEGEKVSSSMDALTGLPVHSLYGETRKPTAEMLADIDVLVFDLQDIGTRYYTFIYTLSYCMEACQENGKQVIVLDRPNPIGGKQIEGNLVLNDYRSFVGRYPLPNRHGLTIGELALLYRYEYGIDCDLKVIPMEDWHRDMYFDDTGLLWVPPTPNSTGQTMSLLYSGTCLLEGTNISCGRGTTRPFEVVGAPFIEGHRLAAHFNAKGLAGVIARPTSYRPTYEKYQDELCFGVQLHITDKYKINSFKTGLYLLESLAELYPESFAILDQENPRCHFNLLAGTDTLMKRIGELKVDRFLQECEGKLEAYKTQVEPYLLYN